MLSNHNVIDEDDPFPDLEVQFFQYNFIYSYIIGLSLFHPP